MADDGSLVTTGGGAEDNEDANSAVGRILQLEETVINRIAAGEVVVRPANALKELMENSIDAKSKHIVVVVKAGGLKMLRIEDDGHGIRKEDLPILCERFTTSKLRKYEDLSSIGTFGFRGEALASISHVAHVTVTTMTANDACAQTAQYTDGKLRGPAKPCAGTRGTTLVVEDLFYNNLTRRQALSKESIEHTKILEVVQKYSIHYPTVSFACRKAGGGRTSGAVGVSELLTPGGDATKTSDVIGLLYGQALSAELFPFEGSSAESSFDFRGYASGPNWSARSCTLTLFINHRLVDCSPLKRAIEAVYMPVLPRHQHPWVYLELEVDPATIDVNVHPTKNEVQFLNEELIAKQIQDVLHVQLKERGGTRTFGSAPLSTTVSSKAKTDFFGHVESSNVPTAEKIVEQKKITSADVTRVRTDHRQRSLESLWREGGAVVPAAAQDAPTTTSQKPTVDPVSEHPQPMEVDDSDDKKHGQKRPENVERNEHTIIESFEEAQALTSICELREAAELLGDAKLSKSLNQSVYVGPVAREQVLLQCGGTLCLVNLARVARECAYQRLLRKFGGVSALKLKEPLPLRELLLLGVHDPGSGYDPERHQSVDIETLVASMVKVFEEKAEMLNEYFSMELSAGALQSLPNALGVTTDAGLSFDGLPLFLVRMCAETNWDEETACLDGLCRLFADFVVETMLPSEEEAIGANTSRIATMAAFADGLTDEVESGKYEDVAEAAAAAASRKRRRTPKDGSGSGDSLSGLQWLHEAVRRDAACSWPEAWCRDGTVLELVSLDQLYRIFERC